MQDGLGARVAKASTSIMTNRACLSPTPCVQNAFVDSLSSFAFSRLYYVLSNITSVLKHVLSSYLSTSRQMIDWEFAQS